MQRNLKLAREGDRFMFLGVGAWGKGATIAEARRNFVRAGGTTDRPYHILSVHPDATVDRVDGSVLSPQGHGARELFFKGK